MKTTIIQTNDGVFKITQTSTETTTSSSLPAKSVNSMLN